VTGQSATDDVDLVHVLGREEQLFATRSGEEDVDRGVDALVADLAVENELHVAGTLELLEDEVIHAAVGLDQGGGHDGEGAGLLGVAGCGEEFARDLHGAGVHAAAHGAASAALCVVEGTADTGQGVHEDEDVLPLLDQALGTVDGDLGDAGVAAEIAVVRAGVEFGLRDGAADFRNLFGTLVDQQDDEFHLGVVLHDGIGDVLKEGGLAGAGRRHDESALALADWRHEIDDAGGEALGDGLELDALVGTDGGQFLEVGDVHVLGRILSLDLGGPEKLDASGSATGLSLDKHAVAQVELTDHLGGDEDVVLGGGVSALGLAEESEALARDLDHALGVGGFRRRPIVGSCFAGNGLCKFIWPGAMLSLASLSTLATLIVGAAVILTVVAEGPASAGIASASATTAVAVKSASPTLLPSLGRAVLATLTGGGIGRWLGCRLVVRLALGFVIVVHGIMGMKKWVLPDCD